ncbi:hypothetical protein PUN28_003143 [Cardiocondyla obscurior]|uniref:Secreted protein n=1 Tax=Cardiocondyla obscurior TaxID=286306 RepID=A0AAW2GMH1_9HYME
MSTIGLLWFALHTIYGSCRVNLAPSICRLLSSASWILFLNYIKLTDVETLYWVLDQLVSDPLRLPVSMLRCLDKRTNVIMRTAVRDIRY